MQAFLLRIMDCSIFDPSNILSRIVYRCKSKLPWSFKCNSFLSTPIRMFGLSQKLLFLILIFGSFSKFLFWAQIRLHFFITIAFFWIQPQYAYDFSTFNLTMCLWCARYNRILSRLWLNTISEQTTRSHHSTNSETSIQWCSLKYHPTLKSHSNAKLHIILEQNGTFQNH